MVWNSGPGALLTSIPGFSDSLTDFPFNFGTTQKHEEDGCENYSLKNNLTSTYRNKIELVDKTRTQTMPTSNSKTAIRNISESKFTAVIYTTLATSSNSVHLSAPIFKLARNVASSTFVDQVSVIPIHKYLLLRKKTCENTKEYISVILP